MIVIGDVHGRFDLLMDLFQKLPQTENIFFVGDLIDRGPDSKKVVDFIIENKYYAVIGNHEEFLIHSLYENESGKQTNHGVYEMWIENGGNATLDSFKSDIWNYLNWFKELPLFLDFTVNDKKYLISHSYAFNGIETERDDVLWGRSFFKDIDGDVINIFGHTIHREPIQYYDKHWCIDTGSHYHGCLTAIDLNTNTFFQGKKG